MLYLTPRRELENAELQYQKLNNRSEDLQHQLAVISGIGEGIPGERKDIEERLDEVSKQIVAINEFCNQLDDAIHPF